MKHLVIITLFTLSAVNSAYADGFRCIGQNTGLHLDVFNQVDAAAGTRVPASMTISNPANAEGNQTLVTFTDDKLIYQGKGLYQAKIDLRAIGSFHKDAIIGGAKLAELKRIDLDIDFSYAEDGITLARMTDDISGKVSYLKRTGEVIEETVVCQRYLKD